MADEQFNINARLLAEAIHQGHVEKAKQHAEVLAKAKVNVRIYFIPEEVEGNSQDIEVKVHVEDRESSAVFQLKISPQKTFRELKSIVHEKQSFPREVQRWFVGRRLAEDSRTLYSLGIRRSGSSLYLYLASAASVQDLHDSGYINTAPSPLPTSTSLPDISVSLIPSRIGPQVIPPDVIPEDITVVNTSYTALAEAPTDVCEEISPEVVAAASAPATASGINLSSHSSACREPLPRARWEEIGWNCPRCTLNNEPTRPSCEACGEDRPESFQVPENAIDFVSEKERERLLRVEQDRIYAQEEMERQNELEQESLSFWQAQLQLTEMSDLQPNPGPFTCTLCQTPIEELEGVMLRECSHCFCRSCLEEHVNGQADDMVFCPYFDSRSASPCGMVIDSRERSTLLAGSGDHPAFRVQNQDDPDTDD